MLTKTTARERVVDIAISPWGQFLATQLLKPFVDHGGARRSLGPIGWGLSRGLLGGPRLAELARHWGYREQVRLSLHLFALTRG